MTKQSVINLFNAISPTLLKRNISDPYKFKQFRAYNAYVGEESIEIVDSTDRTIHLIRLIKSYNTIVAFVDVNEHVFCEIGKFSKTTSKQMTQIYNAYYSGWNRINANHYNCY